MHSSTVIIAARVPADLAGQFAEIASHDERTVSSAIRYAMRIYVESGNGRTREGTRAVADTPARRGPAHGAD